MERYTLVRLTHEEIPELIALSDRLGWDYAEPELQVVLHAGLAFGHKDENGRLVSSAAIFPYAGQLASIGMVMVNPDHRRLGLGKKVTEHCIASVSASHNPVPVMLIATAQGQPMYEQIGFHSVASVHKHIAERYLVPSEKDAPTAGKYTVAPYSAGDFQEVLHLDARAVGATRDAFLPARIEQARERLLLKNADGETVGFGLRVETPALLVLGPIVAPNAEGAALLIDALARRTEGQVRIDVPSGQEVLLPFLKGTGFKKVGQPPVMVLHSDSLPPRNQTLFGIAAQAYG